MNMIIGYGSLSWLIVRDLAARLPFMRQMSERLQKKGFQFRLPNVQVALRGLLQ